MLRHLYRVIDRRPLLAIEYLMYLLLVIAAVWGLHPENDSISIERLASQFGMFTVKLQFSVFLLVGLYGHLSVITGRIEHRVTTSMAAFLSFAYALVTNVIILTFGGIFNPVSTMLYTFSGLVAGVIYVHLKAEQRNGAVGRWRYIPWK